MWFGRQDTVTTNVTFSYIFTMWVIIHLTWVTVILTIKYARASHAASDATLTMLVVIRFTCKRRVAQKCALHWLTFVLFLWSIRKNLPQLYSVVALCLLYLKKAYGGQSPLFPPWSHLLLCPVVWTYSWCPVCCVLQVRKETEGCPCVSGTGCWVHHSISYIKL